MRELPTSPHDNLSPLDRRRFKEKRALGELNSYVPWVKVDELPSNRDRGSKRYFINGRTTGRLHHLFSNGEAALFHLFNYMKHVVDIREQFPLLPQSATVDLAERLNIDHPHEGAHPMVLTVDFLLTIEVQGKRSLRAVSFKQAADLSVNKVHTLRRQELERRFFADHGLEGQAVPWSLTTEKELPVVLLQNLSRLDPDSTKITALTADLRRYIEDRLAQKWTPYLPQVDLARQTDLELSLPPGTAMAMLQTLILSGDWQVDLQTQDYHVNRPLPHLKLRTTR